MPKTVQTLTDKECELLLEQLYLPPGRPLPRRQNTRNYTMALLMLDAGLRVGELVQMRKCYLIFAGEFMNDVQVPYQIAKNKIARAIPMTERLRDAIKAMQIEYWQPNGCPPDGFCFYLHKWSKPLNVRQVQRIITTAGQMALHKQVWPHMLRHTFATRLMRKTSTRVVQTLLGHKSLTSTQVYTHPNNQDLKKAISGIEKGEK